ncbi:MAG: RNA polymerase sigma factor SigI [Gemmatimonadota bacterium]
MPDGQDGGRIGQAYREHRPYLVDLAFRMLGDIGAAEDVVQDAFARLLRTGSADIADERGWLIVVTSRLCLDRIRSAPSRRERAREPGDFEAAAPPAQPALSDPADRVTFDDSVRLALLVMLQRLTPAERVVFVLHDIFQMPFGTIAQTVGRTPQACRQLATRARQKIAAGAGGTRFDVTSAEHRLVTEKFIAACAGGDLSGLLTVLAPGAWGDVDYGPAAARPHVVVTGARRVARNLLHYWGPAATLVSHPVGGQPAVLGFLGHELAGVLVLTLRGERIQTVHVIADPAKLSFLSLQLTGPAGSR